MKLRRTEVRFEITDPSGYNFDVICKHNIDPDLGDCGWSAVASMKTSGSKTPESALEHLRYSANAFLNHLDELK